jgi:hypothetical protein
MYIEIIRFNLHVSNADFIPNKLKDDLHACNTIEILNIL